MLVNAGSDSGRVGYDWSFRDGSWCGKLSQALTQRRLAMLTDEKAGRMFSMLHCTAYECNLCGSNSRSESDGKPLYLCPECLAKLLYATGTDPKKRFKSLIDFCNLNGLMEEAGFYRRSLEAINL